VLLPLRGARSAMAVCSSHEGDAVMGRQTKSWSSDRADDFIPSGIVQHQLAKFQTPSSPKVSKVARESPPIGLCSPDLGDSEQFPRPPPSVTPRVLLSMEAGVPRLPPTRVAQVCKPGHQEKTFQQICRRQDSMSSQESASVLKPPSGTWGGGKFKAQHSNKGRTEEALPVPNLVAKAFAETICDGLRGVLHPVCCSEGVNCEVHQNTQQRARRRARHSIGEVNVEIDAGANDDSYRSHDALLEETMIPGEHRLTEAYAGLSAKPSPQRDSPRDGWLSPGGTRQAPWVESPGSTTGEPDIPHERDAQWGDNIPVAEMMNSTSMDREELDHIFDEEFFEGLQGLRVPELPAPHFLEDADTQEQQVRGWKEEEVHDGEDNMEAPRPPRRRGEPPPARSVFFPEPPTNAARRIYHPGHFAQWAPRSRRGGA